MRSGDSGVTPAGVQHCGSVWTCAVCAAKISEGRRLEVARAIDTHMAGGGLVYMAAFTVPHDAAMPARDLRRLVANNWRKIQAGSGWKAAKAKAGLAHTVRALEVTHGGNGWHPHLHVLFLLDHAEGVEELGLWLFERWAKLTAKAGYGDCNPAVFRLEQAASAEAAGQYVTKWGAPSELTKGHMKMGREGGRSPFQLLADAKAGDGEAAALFAEYAEAFHGARQLTWSKGAKDALGVTEMSDEEVLQSAADDLEKAPSLGQVPAHIMAELNRRDLLLGFIHALERRRNWQDGLHFLRRHGIDINAPPWRAGSRHERRRAAALRRRA